MKTVRTRNIFINSEAHEDGLGRSRIACPPQPFSLQPGEFMRLTLLAFSIPRAWSNVNLSNNVLHWYVPSTGAKSPIVIEPGEYADFVDGVATVLEVALQTFFTNAATCEYQAITRRFVLTTGPTMADGTTPVATDGYFVSYADKFTANRLYDTHHLLGLIPTFDDGQERNAMAGNTVGTAQHTTALPPLINTVDALYLRASTQSDSMQTHDFDAGSPKTLELTHSSIVARIPVNDDFPDYVRFDEQGGLTWELYPLARQLDHLSFWVTDDRGRNVSSLVPGVNQGGLLPFTAAFRWEALVPDLPPKPPPRGGLSGNYMSALTTQT